MLILMVFKIPPNRPEMCLTEPLQQCEISQWTRWNGQEKQGLLSTVSYFLQRDFTKKLMISPTIYQRGSFHWILKRARCLNTGRVAFCVTTTGGAPITCVIHGPKTRHVFGMYEKMSVEITTSENSWNRACYISAYYSFLIAVGLLSQSKTSELANKYKTTFITLPLWATLWERGFELQFSYWSK